MMRCGLPRCGAFLAMVVCLAGCASSGPFPYRVTNEGCECARYVVRDPGVEVRYEWSATYRVDGQIASTISIVIVNDTRDTLDLSLAYVRVSSRNVGYRYNNRSLPVGIPCVRPLSHETLTLTGEGTQAQGDDPWLAVAGEEMRVSLHGMRIGSRTLVPQEIVFVPKNPKLAG